MARIIVYLGPSLALSEAKAILEADYRPPIRRDDLKKALNADIIGIIDGTFFNDSPVVHKELLAILNRGIIVVGGSSMGALRASEMDAFGMIGAGRIYECYKSGRIVADDEVAVTYNPVTGEPLSEPLVNIRYQLKAAADDGIISGHDRKGLIALAAAMHYPERTYEAILKRAIEQKIMNKEKASALARYVKDKPRNLKAEDAVAVLKKIKGLSSQVSLKSR